MQSVQLGQGLEHALVLMFALTVLYGVIRRLVDRREAARIRQPVQSPHAVAGRPRRRW